MEKQCISDKYGYIVLTGSLKLSDTIDKLHEGYRETFKMSRFDEVSNTDIAKQLGVSVGSLCHNGKYKPTLI